MAAEESAPDVVRAEVAALPPGVTADLQGDTAMRRLHPVTPVLRSWVVIAAGIGFGWTQLTNIVEGQFFGSRGDDGGPSISIWALLFAGALVVALTYGYLYWRFTRYGIHGNVLRIDSGVVFRQSRQMALDRLQAVDIVRPLVARIAGVAELRLEVAGGSSSEAPLAYLSLPRAHQLRAELLARAAGLDASTPEAPERPLHRVPTGHLLMASLLSGATVALVVLGIGVAVTIVVTGAFGAVVPLVPALLGTAVAAIRRFVVNYGFTVSQSPDGLRIRKGLLDTRSQTVPPGRVQAARISHPFLWRTAHLVRVDINVAGYASANEGETEATSVLLPVGPPAVAYDLLQRVLPELDLTNPALRPAPRRARGLRPRGWRHLRVGVLDRFFVAEQGWVSRDVLLMPHAKPQSIRLTQGPAQRRLRLATVHLDSTSGPVAVAALHRDAQEARALLDEEVRRERTARTGAGPDRWALDQA